MPYVPVALNVSHLGFQSPKFELRAPDLTTTSSLHRSMFDCLVGFGLSFQNEQNFAKIAKELMRSFTSQCHSVSQFLG
jgi:hypothetical protein